MKQNSSLSSRCLETFCLAEFCLSAFVAWQMVESNRIVEYFVSSFEACWIRFSLSGFVVSLEYRRLMDGWTFVEINLFLSNTILVTGQHKF